MLSTTLLQSRSQILKLVRDIPVIIIFYLDLCTLLQYSLFNVVLTTSSIYNVCTLNHYTPIIIMISDHIVYFRSISCVQECQDM